MQIKNLLNNVTEVVNRVKNFSEEDYSTAKKEFLSQIIGESILSVYQVGSISVPSISDIDLIVVFKDDLPEEYEKYSIKNLSEDAQYLFSHDGWYIDEPTFYNIHYWFPCFNLRHIYGKLLTTDEKEKFSSKIAFLLLTQYLITKIPSDLIIYSIFYNRFYERIMLCVIHSLSLSFKLAKIVFGEISSKWENFIEEFNFFRAKWFEVSLSSREILLKSYTERAVGIVFELVRLTSEYIEKEVLKTPLTKPFFFLSGKRKIIFAKEWDEDKFVKSLLNSPSTKPEIVLPLAFAFYPLCWGTLSQQHIGKVIRDSLSFIASCSLKDGWEETMEKHIFSIEHYASFHLRKFHIPISGYHTLWIPYENLS